MNKQDRRIGFRTSITEMQDDFNKAYEVLKALKTKWDELRDLASSSVAKLTPDLHAIYKSSRDEHFVILQTALINYWHLVETISLLGIEITDISKQVTNIEKDIKELKLQTK